MEKEQAEDFHVALTALQQKKIRELLKREMNSFQQDFLDKYGLIICDAYQHLRQYGINHFIHYDNYRFLMVKMTEQGSPDTGKPSLFIEYERFYYKYPWELKEYLEKKYLDEKGSPLGFKSAFVIEEFEGFADKKIKLDHHDNPLLPLDQAAMSYGFTRMSLSAPVGLRVTAIDGSKEMVGELEGRLLDMHDQKSGRC